VLFTDIVGSTPLAEAAGDDYPRLLVRHRDLLEAAVRRHEGAMAAREGDGCLATFASPSSAVAAAVAGQRALGAEPWPDGLAVRVRMVVHHGDVIDLAGEPVGLALHHAARMLSCAGAGDVIVSSDAAPLVTPADGVELVDAGTHRLRDLPRPVQLRVAADGLPPPDPASPSVPVDVLIGRDREVAEVCAALAGHRLVTITGPGGSGKTRLAQAVAEQWRASGPESPCWVDLAGLSDPTLVPAAALSAVTGERVDDPLVVLTRVLGRRRALVVLDNCEHVAAGVVPVVEAVNRGCPGVRLLATSRARLGCAGEAERQLAPLAVPDDAALVSDDPAVLAGYPGVELFAVRARNARPGFRVSDAAGLLARNASAYDTAAQSYRDALVLFRSCGDRAGEAWSLAMLGDYPLADHEFAVACLDQAIVVFRDIRVAIGLAWSLVFLASRHIREGDLVGARREAEEALAVATEVGASPPQADANRLLGEIAALEGDLVEARRRIEDAGAISRASGDRWQEVLMAAQLGWLAGAAGDLPGAFDQFALAITLAEEIASADRLGIVLDRIVVLLWRLGRREDAARLLGAYDAMSAMPPNAYLDPIARDVAGSELASLRAEGAALSFTDAIAVTREIISRWASCPRTEPGPPRPASRPSSCRRPGCPRSTARRPSPR
jgi:class 3 adenylate cyclase/tetratricopeptide (TPR) repeat protein